MLRSFTDRIFGGVCGGIAAALRLNSWIVRLVVAALTLISAGSFALLYVILWWIIPQESLTLRKRGVPVIFVLLFTLLALAAWFGRDALRAPTGENLFWVGALVVTSAIFFLRQVVRV